MQYKNTKNVHFGYKNFSTTVPLLVLYSLWHQLTKKSRQERMPGPKLTVQKSWKMTLQ